MARKSTSGAPRGRGWGGGFRFVLRVIFVCALGLAALFAFGQLEQVLIHNPRFIVAGPPDYDQESPDVKVTGLRHASRARILAVFSRDYGRSLYLFPAAERRRNLLAVNWVKDASVRRVWPNHVEAQIAERVPVAFIQLGGVTGQSVRFALIDEDGVILEAESPAQFKLPVIVGLPVDADIDVRRDRVRRAMRLAKELGASMNRVSEIDVADPDNLKVTTEVDNRALVLMLGNQHFLLRFNNFQNHYAKIREHLPDATALDLRLEDRITAVGGAHDGG